jgi:antitoxin YefM
MKQRSSRAYKKNLSSRGALESENLQGGLNMITVTVDDARESLDSLLAQVNSEHSAVTITSVVGNGVLMSEEDYEAWQTTLHLFSMPANARRLAESIARSQQQRDNIPISKESSEC